MELVTLDADRQPKNLIENYDSLIWAERFNTVGDFQIQTGDIDRFMNILPEGQLVTLRESTVPMIVETHQIVRKKNSPQNLIIKGREFTSILDRRISIDAVVGGSSAWNVVAKIPSDVAYYIIEKICVEGILSVSDIFPSDVVEFITPDDYLTGTGPNRQFSVPRGNLLSTVLQFLQAEAIADPTTIPPTPDVVPHGIRSIRPNAAGTAIGVEIYKGVDRSDTVYFDGSRNLLDDGSYLFSKIGSANAAYVIGQGDAIEMNTSPVPATGLDRRVILVDGSATSVLADASLAEQGIVSLSKAHETAIFDGSLNQELSSYVYGVDYFLGDTVKLVGDYGLREKARVAEYIRSVDKTGSKSYPTLITVEE